MQAKTAAYWVSTLLLAAAMLSGGAAELARRPDNVEGMLHLGYPLYFVAIIGFWKVLGAIALLVPRFPRLKEWACAGIFFNMTGAFASHVALGDAAGHLIATGVLALLTMASWWLRPRDRVLGTIRTRLAGALPAQAATLGA